MRPTWGMGRNPWANYDAWKTSPPEEPDAPDTEYSCSNCGADLDHDETEELVRVATANKTYAVVTCEKCGETWEPNVTERYYPTPDDFGCEPEDRD